METFLFQVVFIIQVHCNSFSLLFREDADTDNGIVWNTEATEQSPTMLYNNWNKYGAQ